MEANDLLGRIVGEAKEALSARADRVIELVKETHREQQEQLAPERAEANAILGALLTCVNTLPKRAHATFNKSPLMVKLQFALGPMGFLMEELDLVAELFRRLEKSGQVSGKTVDLSAVGLAEHPPAPEAIGKQPGGSAA